MGRSCTVLTMALALWIVVPPAQGALMRDVFSVRNVPVDETAKTASIARTNAIRNGQRTALNFLFERIVLRSDEEALPLLSNDEVTALVQGFEVANEKTSSRRYLANLTFRFKKKDVRALLKRAGVPFTETVAKPMLVLPVFAMGTNRILWDDPNPWRRAWALRERLDDGLLPFVVPFGDLEDLTVIDADRAITGDEAALKKIARRYDAEEVLVAHAAVSFANDTDEPNVQVVLRRYGPLGERVVVEQFGGRRGDQITDLLLWVANAITVDLEEEWKALTLLDFGTKFALDARVPLADLKDWLAVRRLLSESAVVQKIDLQALTTREARVGLEFVGNSRGLVVALAQRDLDLVYNEGLWTLSLRKEQVIESAISAEDSASDIEWQLEGSDVTIIPGNGVGGGYGVATEGDRVIIRDEGAEGDTGDGALPPSIQSGDGFSTTRSKIFSPLPEVEVEDPR